MGNSSSRRRPEQQADAYGSLAGGPGQAQHPQQQQQQQQQQHGGHAHQQHHHQHHQHQHHQQLPPRQQVQPYTTNGGQLLGGGYAPPQTLPLPPPNWGRQFAQPPVAGNGFGQPPRPVATHEYQQTATIKNQVNLKKASLAVAPLPGRPHEFGLSFKFDATAPCRVTTFLLATEDPRGGCRLTSAVLGAPPRTPACYEKGMDLKFPPEGDAAAAEAHVISSLQAPMGHMVLASGDSYPLVIRLESLMEEGRREGHTLQELEVGGPFPAWAQAQTTYAKLKQDEEGRWRVVVLKQKIWFRGTSYELQEIYGMDGGKGSGEAAADDGLGGSDCVICLAAERTTTVLPCRHMCMCRECALALKTRTNKCPICREEIHSLLHIQIARKGAQTPGGSERPATPVAG